MLDKMFVYRGENFEDPSTSSYKRTFDMTCTSWIVLNLVCQMLTVDFRCYIICLHLQNVEQC